MQGPQAFASTSPPDLLEYLDLPITLDHRIDLLAGGSGGELALDLDPVIRRLARDGD